MDPADCHDLDDNAGESTSASKVGTGSTSSTLSGHLLFGRSFVSVSFTACSDREASKIAPGAMYK